MLRFSIVTEGTEASTSSNLPRKAIYIKRLINDSSSKSDDLDSEKNKLYISSDRADEVA
jgi:hypothetical protein